VLLATAAVMSSSSAMPVHAQAATDLNEALVVKPLVPIAPKNAKKHKKKPHGHPKSVVGMIKEVFGPHADEALRIARCESSMNPSEVNSIGATGLFQIRAGMHSWRVKKVHGTSLTDPWTNVRVAYSLMKDEGWAPWVCAHRLGISSGYGDRRPARTHHATRARGWSTHQAPREPRRPGR
jgi:hypothetical protein